MMEKGIESFKAWAVKNGWPATFMPGNIPDEWKGGLKAIYELWISGWRACEKVRGQTLVWDD
jgi:hypothetical protein